MALVIVVAGLLLANMVTDGPTSHLAYAQTADSYIEYAENGTGPVGTFIAYDQDGDVIEWSLSGPDEDLFTIDGGVLRFKMPPNYEDPQSAARGGQRAEGNVYRVTYRGFNGGTHDVDVTVVDVDEAERGEHRPAAAAGCPGRSGQACRTRMKGCLPKGGGGRGRRTGTTWTDIRGSDIAAAEPGAGR